MDEMIVGGEMAVVGLKNNRTVFNTDGTDLAPPVGAFLRFGLCKVNERFIELALRDALIRIRNSFSECRHFVPAEEDGFE